MSRLFLFIGVVTIWAISCTFADKPSSQVSKGKQRGDQTLTAEDGLVAPSFETKIQPNKHTDKHAKKKAVGVAVVKKGPTRPHKKYSPPNRLSARKKPKVVYKSIDQYLPKGKRTKPVYGPLNSKSNIPRRPQSKLSSKPTSKSSAKTGKTIKGGNKKNKGNAERRDSSYGAPAPYHPPAPKRKVIIKQAGPSKQFAWVGHQPYHNPGHNVPGHVFAAADLPKWSLMGNNIFNANLLYPGKVGGAPSKSKETYKPPPPAPTTGAPPVTVAPIYVAPKPAAPSYGPPPAPAAPAYESPKPSAPAYSAPAPAAPAYSAPSAAAPVYQPAAAAPPVYSTQAPPIYQPSASPPSVYVGQPSYVPSYPSIQYVPSQPPAAPTPPATTASYASPTPSIYARPQPNIYTQFGSFPAYSALPPAPAASSPANVYNVPLKVEESYESPAGENDEVFYIFYEDKKPAASYESPQYKQPPSPQNDISPYIVEDVQANPNQFSAPNADDIHTVYVPFQNAVNVPATYDVSVASSFGYSGGAPSQQAGTGASPPNYSGFPNFPATGSSASPPSYDNPISSYDAPILDDNSYTAKSPIRDVLYYGDATGIQSPQKDARRPVRNLRLLPAVPDEPTLPSRSVKGSFASSSEEAKFLNGRFIQSQKHGKSFVPYGTRLGPRQQYTIVTPGL